MEGENKELLQAIVDVRDLAHFQLALAEHEAELSVDWKELEIKLSSLLLKFGVPEVGI